MTADKNQSLFVRGVEIHVMPGDFVSLTDMAAGFEDSSDLINSWLRNKDTLEFLAVWERLNNPNFNSVEFDRIRMEAGTNRFRLTGKQWAEKTNGIGIIAKTGRYGGTFAHIDIAIEFGSWLNPEFKLFLITEFKRLKEHEAKTSGVEWDFRRALAKINFRVHTDAVKTYLLPPDISKIEAGYVYATETDLLNKALFGVTAKEWKTQNSGKGNLRDNATVEQLLVLSILESQNALLIEQGKSPIERLRILNKIARQQLKSILDNPSVKSLISPKKKLLE